MTDSVDSGAVSNSVEQEIKETDIVFDCPFCGKSLAIDYRGAGLSIPCSDCGKRVDVPIPDGLDISDIERTDEEKEVLLQNVRRSLIAAESRITSLESEIEELNHRRDDLEKTRTDNIYRFGAISEKCGVIQKALDDLSEALRKIVEIARQ